MPRITTDRAFLESLTTKRLLAYKNSLLSVPDTSSWDNERGGRGKVNKSQDGWKMCYALAKEILATREHIPQGD